MPTITTPTLLPGVEALAEECDAEDGDTDSAQSVGPEQ